MATAEAIAAQAEWCVSHQPWFSYLESRPFPLFVPTATHHMANDCSATVVLCYWLAGAPDPTGNSYSGFGNTDTLAAHGTQVSAGAVQVADLVIYGPIGATVHTALVVEAGADPLTMSHGQSSEPGLVRVSQGNPTKVAPRFYRYDLGAAPAPPTTEDDEMISTLNDGISRHVFVYANGRVEHWWQPLTGPSVTWSYEVLPVS